MEILLILHGAAFLIAAIAAVTDARTGHIPNWLTLPALVIGPILNGLNDGAWGLGLSVAAIFLCGLIPYVLFRRKAMGGGDVKLLAAIGALAGPSIGIEVQLTALFVAAIYALGRLAWKGKLLRTLRNTFFLGVNPVLPRRWRRHIAPELMEAVRLGVPIFAGTLYALLTRHLFFFG